MDRAPQMTLSNQVSFPQSRAYVLKLHSDCSPANGRFAGQLEHVTSGRVLYFHSTEELLACLLRDLAAIAMDSTENQP
jgi:hypothetical protein